MVYCRLPRVGKEQTQPRISRREDRAVRQAGFEGIAILSRADALHKRWLLPRYPRAVTTGGLRQTTGPLRTAAIHLPSTDGVLANGYALWISTNHNGLASGYAARDETTHSRTVTPRRPQLAAILARKCATQTSIIDNGFAKRSRQ